MNCEISIRSWRRSGSVEQENVDLETGVVNAAEFSRQSGGSNAADRHTQGELACMLSLHSLVRKHVATWENTPLFILR